MRIYLNRTELAALLGIAPRTLALRIADGKIKPDAQDGHGRDLFLKSKHEKKAKP